MHRDWIIRIKNLIGDPSDFGLGWILVIASSFLIIAIWISKLLIGFIKYLRRDKLQLEKIEQLATETNIQYFKELLGDPAFINRKQDYKEYIFKGEKFYIQAVTDGTEKVLMFSVTTRSKEFNPSLTLGPFTLGVVSPVRIKLGKTKFSVLDQFDEPEIRYRIGANWFYYTEFYYFGRPGKYQKYAFGLSQSGYLETKNTSRDLLDSQDLERKDLVPFRDGAVMNTYAIIAPSCDKKLEDMFVNENILIGADYHQVWVLK